MMRPGKCVVITEAGKYNVYLALHQDSRDFSNLMLLATVQKASFLHFDNIDATGEADMERRNINHCKDLIDEGYVSSLNERLFFCRRANVITSMVPNFVNNFRKDIVND